jgi:predicted RNase H-like nuclease (RuvC/YqgF family)
MFLLFAAESAPGGASVSADKLQELFQQAPLLVVALLVAWYAFQNISKQHIDHLDTLKKQLETQKNDKDSQINALKEQIEKQKSDKDSQISTLKEQRKADRLDMDTSLKKNEAQIKSQQSVIKKLEKEIDELNKSLQAVAGYKQRADDEIAAITMQKDSQIRQLESRARELDALLQAERSENGRLLQARSGSEDRP